MQENEIPKHIFPLDAALVCDAELLLQCLTQHQADMLDWSKKLYKRVSHMDIEDAAASGVFKHVKNLQNAEQSLSSYLNMFYFVAQQMRRDIEAILAVKKERDQEYLLQQAQLMALDREEKRKEYYRDYQRKKKGAADIAAAQTE